MSKIIFICCFLLSFSLFAQQKEAKQDSITIPTSLFAMHTFDIQDVNNSKMMNSLYLTGFEFFIVNQNLTNLNQCLYFKNIGRKISLDELIDNYQKKELNKYFFKGDEIWNVGQQNRYCQD